MEPDIPAILKSLSLTKGSYSRIVIHGGEPLYDPRVFTRFVELVRRFLPDKQISIQTNGIMLQEMAEFIAKNKIHVGVSIDSLDPSGNALRCHGCLKKILDGIKMLVRYGQVPGVISVVTKVSIPFILETVKELKNEFGIIDYRLNPVDRGEFEPDHHELRELYLDTLSMIEHGIRIFPTIDLIRGVFGSTRLTCNFRGCDPIAPAIPLILPNGQVTGCLKARMLRFRRQRPARPEILRQMPMEEGGCKGCRWWPVCKGGCPSEANNYFGKSRYCDVWKGVRDEISARIPSKLRHKLRCKVKL